MQKTNRRAGGAWGWALGSMATGCCALGSASAFDVVVQTEAGPVADAVVWAVGEGAKSMAPVSAVVDQIGSEFVPRVLVIPVGSHVQFPNSDRTRHQVYSFSPAKRFELPLYSGTPPDPVQFDSPGVVTLGCNIHDWMIGFILVLDTPFYARSDANGRARLDLPPGEYAIQIWHERGIVAMQPAELQVRVSDQADDVSVRLELAPLPPPRGTERLRALQEKLRSRRGD